MIISFGKNSPIRYKFTLVEWAHRKDVQEAWKELAAKYDLLDKEFRDIERIFSFTDAALSWSQSIYFRYVSAVLFLSVVKVLCAEAKR